MIVPILKASTLFIFASSGELFSQRSGVLNIGLEGYMLMGGLAAFGIAQVTGNPWIGLLGGMMGGVLLSLLNAFFSVSLNLSQVVSGIGIWMLSIGATSYLGNAFSGPSKVTIQPIIGGLSPLFFIGIMLIFLLWFILSKTTFGLRIRCVGEDPSVAEVSGINVIRTRYIGVLVAGLLAGLSGGYLTLVYNPIWSHMVTAGRGWIALALVFFAMWRPLYLLGSSLFFGALWILALRLQIWIPFISSYLFQSIPYILTILVLVIFNMGKLKKAAKAPAALGLPYKRE